MALTDYFDIEEEDVEPTTEELEAGFKEHTGETWEERYGGGGDRLGGGSIAAQQEAELGASRELARREALLRQGREKYGLTGDKLYEYAEKLAGIAGGEKTEGQIAAEKKLKLLSQAQRGSARSYGGFDAARVLERAAKGAQRTELTGEAAIDAAAIKARQAAKGDLEQLMIAGQQRAEDRAFAMEQLRFQEEQASSSLWSNVLGGILAAIGTGIAAVATGGSSLAVQGAAMAAGGAAAGAGGSAVGRWVG